MQTSFSVKLAFALLLAASGCASNEKPKMAEIRLESIEPSGREVVIKEELGNRVAWKLGSEFAAVDQTLRRRITSGSATTEGALLRDIREELLQELEHGQFIALNTSSGEKNVHLEKSSSLMEMIKKIMQAGPVVASRVTTQIKVARYPDSTVHFTTYKAFRRGMPDWRSYSPGMILDIQAYFFRVDTGTFEYVELVPVWDDPTEATITPRKQE